MVVRRHAGQAGGRLLLHIVDGDARIQTEEKNVGVQIILGKKLLPWHFFYFYLETN